MRPLKVGVFLTPWIEGSDGGVPRWDDVLRRARFAEAAGFDSIWVSDHLLIRPEPDEAIGGWEGWSQIAALAAAVPRVEIGTLVLCALWRNPALLAKMADTVDEISGGRLILGIGAGWHEPEYRAFGYPADHRVARLTEAATILHGLLKQGHLDFQGSYYQMRECELRPRGPRPAGPPILIGGAGPRMIELAARCADIWNRDFDVWNPGVAPYSAEDLAAWRSRVDARCTQVGRDPATLERAASVFVDLPLGAEREGWQALRGTPEAIAEGLRGYGHAGFTRVQVWLEPGSLAGVEAFAEVLALLDRG